MNDLATTPRHARPRPTALVHDSPELSATERLMEAALDGGFGPLQQVAGEMSERSSLSSMATQHLASGGKRLRARLALHATAALGGKREHAIPWAAACELLHNATLVLDDIQDADEVRRGHTAVWSQWGVAQAINVGALMLVLPYKVLSFMELPASTQAQLVAALSHYTEQIVHGQARELRLAKSSLQRRSCPSWSSYCDAAQGKTAGLFAAPIRGAALICGHNPLTSSALAAPFEQLGLLFQIADDLLDAYGDNGKVTRGVDLLEGRMSALVVEHLRLHPHRRGPVLELLARPREQTSMREVDELLAAFESGGAVEAVGQRIAALRADVRECASWSLAPALAPLAEELMSMVLARVDRVPC